jgi:hypothetical protein
MVHNQDRDAVLCGQRHQRLEPFLVHLVDAAVAGSTWANLLKGIHDHEPGVWVLLEPGVQVFDTALVESPPPKGYVQIAQIQVIRHELLEPTPVVFETEIKDLAALDAFGAERDAAGSNGYSESERKPRLAQLGLTD